MIVGIPAMQVYGDSRPSHNPASEGSTETDPSLAPYVNESQGMPAQMHPGVFLGMPPQQVYVGEKGGYYHHMTPDIGALSSHFQSISMQQQPHEQAATVPPQRGAEAPQSGESETEEDNDETTETTEDPVKLFVGQVSPRMCFRRLSRELVLSEITLSVTNVIA